MKTIMISIRLLTAMTIVTGIIYPFLVLVLGSTFFPYKASGSLIEFNGNIRGSELIAQNFDSIAYFTSRPSASNYNPLPSTGSNLGPTSRRLKNNIDSIKKSYTSFNKLVGNIQIPADALFSSGSGLDPHISLENALLQIQRISDARRFNEAKREQLIKLTYDFLETPSAGFLGEPVINVLKLNIELDKL